MHHTPSKALSHQAHQGYITAHDYSGAPRHHSSGLPYLPYLACLGAAHSELVHNKETNIEAEILTLALVEVSGLVGPARGEGGTQRQQEVGSLYHARHASSFTFTHIHISIY